MVPDSIPGFTGYLEISELPVWEVDQPVNIKLKRARISEALGNIPSHITMVAIDLDHEDLEAVLLSHDYPKDKRTFFILEAVTQYLTESGIKTIFSFLAKTAPGSRLVFTYVRKDFVEGRNKFGNERFYNDFVSKKIFLFGMEPGRWPELLKGYGWRVIEDIGFDELAEKYIKPTGRLLSSTPIERMVFAEKL